MRTGKQVTFVPVDDIDWIEAQGDYAQLHVGKREYLLRESLTVLESRLDPGSFLRIHRSAIVNLQHVKEFRTDGTDGECFVTMSDGHKLPVSRGYRSRITGLIAR